MHKHVFVRVHSLSVSSVVSPRFAYSERHPAFNFNVSCLPASRRPYIAYDSLGVLVLLNSGVDTEDTSRANPIPFRSSVH
jgi:hypothetical protein